MHSPTGGCNRYQQWRGAYDKTISLVRQLIFSSRLKKLWQESPPSSDIDWRKSNCNHGDRGCGRYWGRSVISRSLSIVLGCGLESSESRATWLTNSSWNNSQQDGTDWLLPRPMSRSIQRSNLSCSIQRKQLAAFGPKNGCIPASEPTICVGALNTVIFPWTRLRSE